MIKGTENTVSRNICITQVSDRGLSKIEKDISMYKCDSCSTISCNARIQMGYLLQILVYCLNPVTYRSSPVCFGNFCNLHLGVL